MKRIASRLAVFTAATLISVLPVLAGERMGGMGSGNDGAQTKDECLLVSQNCRGNVDTIQERIGRLEREIGKGSRVYTPDELRSLEFQLRDNNELLTNLMKGGA